MMNEKIYITNEFKAELENLKCGFNDNYITVYKTEGDKVFFSAGRGRFHLTKGEVLDIKVKQVSGSRCSIPD